MNKHTLGRVISTIIGAGAIAVSFAAGTPEVVFPALAIGTTGIVFTTVLTQETGEETKIRKNKKFMRMASQEEPEQEMRPVEVYEKLKAGAPQAAFKGVHTRQIVSESGDRWIETRIEHPSGETLVMGVCLDKGPIVIPDDQPQAEPEAQEKIV